MFQILIGIFSGIFSGIGMGGGTILIFFLITYFGVNQYVAQATNLIFFIPTAISAILVNYKNKNIDLKLSMIISIFGIVGSIIGAKVAMNINVEFLKKIFGTFLLVITIHEIYTLYKEYNLNKKRYNKNS